MATYRKLDEENLATASEFDSNSRTRPPKGVAPNDSSVAKTPPHLPQQSVHLHL
jgi:hypothetical protein